MADDPSRVGSEGPKATEGPKAAEGPKATAKRKKPRRRRDETPAEAAPEAEAEAEPEAEASDADPPPEKPAREIPAFAASWPEDEALSALVAAFEAGDYRRVRREAPVLARRTEDDEVRRAARELVRRLDPEPAAVYMLAVAAMLLVVLAGWYWSHPHHP